MADVTSDRLPHPYERLRWHPCQRSMRPRRRVCVAKPGWSSRLFAAMLVVVTDNLKHRTFLMTLYSGGLRFAEAANLRIHGINWARMQIRVACGKVRKERLVPLSPNSRNVD